MDAYSTPTWEVEARKHLEKLPDEMKKVERVRTAHLADAQACTRKLEAMRAEQKRLRRVLGDGADGKDSDNDDIEAGGEE